MGVDTHAMHTTDAHSASEMNSTQELTGATGLVVAALAAASASMFAAAVLSVFARIGWKQLRDRRRRRKQNAIAELSACAGIESKVEVSPSESQIVAVVSIEGMTCSACSGAVEKALKAVEGVLSVEVNLLTQSSRILFRAPATASSLCETIEDIGFGATLSSTEEQRSASDLQNQDENAQKEALLAIEGMTCSACSGAVERALNALSGVSAVEVNLLSQSARVVFSAPAVVQQLRDEVADIGFGATVQSETKLAAASERESKDTIAILSIEGMTCAACSGAVERALMTEDGVQSAEVNLLAQSANILFRSPATVERLVETVEDIGFAAEVASVSQKSEKRCSAQAFANSLPNQSNACLLRLSFPDSQKLHAAQAEISKRAGIAGVVAQNRKRELRVSYWSQEVGARSLLEELQKFNACWAGDSKLGDDDHVVRAFRALLTRYLLSVPPTAVIFIVAFIIPNVFPESPLVEPLESEVCCAGALSWKTLLLILLSAPVQFGIGLPLHRSALRALSSGHLSMDVLVSLGTTLAFMYSFVVTIVWMIIGLEMPEALIDVSHDGGHHGNSIAPPPHFFEASAMLLSILMLGKCIESYAKRMTGDSLRELASHWPTEARLAGATGGSTSVPCDLLQVGDLLAVTVGETLPCDGIVKTGDMHVDESILTGEDKPVRKKPGDLLVGGSKCLDGHAEFEATAIGANTAMSQIAKMVEAAQSTKPDIERVASKVSAIFVPTILGLSLLTFSVWTLLVAVEAVEVPTSLVGSRDAHQSEARMAEQSFFISRFALALMMMACPCAFGLAAPTAILVATGSAARKGCLIKSGQALEVAQNLKAIVLDKTGTVTVGAPTVTNVALCHSHPALQNLSGNMLKPGTIIDGKQTEWLPGSEGEASSKRPTDAQVSFLWSVVGSIEAPSQHPLGKAIHLHSKSLLQMVPVVEDWQSVTGLGVEGRVPNLGWVRMGRLSWALTGKAPPKKCACPQTCRCTKATNCGCSCWAEAEDAPNAEEDTSLLKKTTGDISECCCGSLCRCSEGASCGCTCFVRRLSEVEVQVPPNTTPVEQWIENVGAQGAGVVVVTLNNELLGAVVMRDVLQPGVPEAVRILQAKGIDVWLCSGDQKSTTKAVAAELGIKYWMGECMPQDKARHVAELASKASVGFVGDGVNDAIALGAATLGVAIGAGAHVTVDAADVVLVRSAFEDFLGFIHLARVTLRTIRMNYVWAFGFNLVGLPLAAGVLYPRVHLPPVVAGAAMAGSSLMVVMNSLRLRSAGGAWSRQQTVGANRQRPEGSLDCCIGRSESERPVCSQEMCTI